MRHPVLYEIYVKPWLEEVCRGGGETATLWNVPEEELERLGGLGVDFVWLLGVWPTGAKSVAVAREYEDLQKPYRWALRDFEAADVVGSPYAISAYRVASDLGGPEALADLRRRLAARDIRLILDFVANHTGLDCPWVVEHPEFYVRGTAQDLAESPGEFFESDGQVLAHGRDPKGSPWTDTAQLNLMQQPVRERLRQELEEIADQCDGVRCDMTMLGLESVFLRTWAGRVDEKLEGATEDGAFWRQTIDEIRRRRRGFLFLAEVYWDLEDRMRSVGFDYTYDKRLYDRLRTGGGSEVRSHLGADPEWQTRCVRFLENHDEERAADVMKWPRHRAAAVIAGTVPGMWLLHDGQLEGRRARLPIQLRRRAPEPANRETLSFYRRLLGVLNGEAERRGEWGLLPLREASPGNPTWEDFVAFRWRRDQGADTLVVVNFGPTRGQCYVEVAEERWQGRVSFEDLIGTEHYVRDGAEAAAKGLYFDMPAYGYHVFRVGRDQGA